MSLKGTVPINDISRNIIIPFTIDGEKNANTCDLNKIFQVNLTYNVDLLKNLLEGILKCQKEAELKIQRLESKFPDLQELSNKTSSSINIKSSNTSAPQQEGISMGGTNRLTKENQSSTTKNNLRPTDTILEESNSKDELGKIIVSQNFLIIYN